MAIGLDALCACRSLPPLTDASMGPDDDEAARFGWAAVEDRKAMGGEAAGGGGGGEQDLNNSSEPERGPDHASYARATFCFLPSRTPRCLVFPLSLRRHTTPAIVDVDWQCPKAQDRPRRPGSGLAGTRTTTPRSLRHPSQFQSVAPSPSPRGLTHLIHQSAQEPRCSPCRPRVVHHVLGHYTVDTFLQGPLIRHYFPRVRYTATRDSTRSRKGLMA